MLFLMPCIHWVNWFYLSRNIFFIKSILKQVKPPNCGFNCRKHGFTCESLTPFRISCIVTVDREFAPGLWLRPFSLVPLESTLFQHILYSNSIKSIASHFIASVVTTGANGGNALF